MEHELLYHTLAPLGSQYKSADIKTQSKDGTSKAQGSATAIKVCTGKSQDCTGTVTASVGKSYYTKALAAQQEASCRHVSLFVPTVQAKQCAFRFMNVLARPSTVCHM